MTAKADLRVGTRVVTNRRVATPDPERFPPGSLGRALAYDYPAGTQLTVVDLFARKSYCEPLRVGVSHPAHRGLAFGVDVDALDVQ